MSQPANAESLSQPQLPPAVDDGCARHGGQLFGGMAVTWLLLGSLLFVAAANDTKLEHERLLLRKDEILGIGVRATLILLGAYHLVLGLMLFWLRDPIFKVAMLFWGISVCVIYRLGSAWLAAGSARPGRPGDISTLAAAQLGITPRGFDNLWTGLLVGMSIGAVAHLLMVRHRRKRAEAQAFLAQWRKSHQAKVRFPWAG
jgi:hypothetical protein